MADFIAGYISGVISIAVGSPLDIIKVRLQATAPASPAVTSFPTTTSLLRGVAAPILGYGALNALLFGAYNRCFALLPHATYPLTAMWAAGAVGGLATFVISAPTELMKCKTQMRVGGTGSSTWDVTREVWKREGVRGLYRGGAVTALRDGFGYGWYFWAYELCRRALAERGVGATGEALIAGGVAGCVTWASIYPVDVVKTRVQSGYGVAESRSLLGAPGGEAKREGAWACTKRLWRTEGVGVFWRGIGVCMLRAFVVNAVQRLVYEEVLRIMADRQRQGQDTGTATGFGVRAGEVMI
ncbi:solute carrier family 25 member 45 [Geopyxis carbonaria]|nr:solute carrier family 25 member 45 [Geopyxis carbonaria]